MSERRKVVNALRDADDLVYLITGKRIKNLVQRGAELFGEDLKTKAVGKEPEVVPDSPYIVLEVRPDASNLVVKASFRAKAREYHPDSGRNPNPQAFQRAVEAYDRIMGERSGKE